MGRMAMRKKKMRMKKRKRRKKISKNLILDFFCCTNLYIFFIAVWLFFYICFCCLLHFIHEWAKPFLFSFVWFCYALRCFSKAKKVIFRFVVPPCVRRFFVALFCL